MAPIFLVRRKIAEKEKSLTDTELPNLEELLQTALKVYQNTKEGHSYQSLTGKKINLLKADELKTMQEEIITLKLCSESTYFHL